MGAMISAGGLGDVTLNGTGGASTGSNNYGVYVFNSAATVSSSGGDIHIMAQGGGTGAGGSNIGFHLQSQGKIEANGMGEILIEGNGGPAQGGGNHGALIFHVGTSITTDNGDIEIIGNGNGIVNAGTSYGIEVNSGLIHAGGDGNVILEGSGAMTMGNLNHGVTILGAQGEVTTAAGDISITGIPGLNTNALGIQHATGAEIHTLMGGGNISLAANSMNIQSTISTITADTVFISSLSIDTSIILGITPNGNTGPLKLSDAELDAITTGTLMIGTNTAGTITVADTITREVQTVVNLTSGGDVIFDGGHLNTDGGNSELDPGTTPAAVKPLKDSIDVFCDTLTFGSDLAIRINSTPVSTITPLT